MDKFGFIMRTNKGVFEENAKAELNAVDKRLDTRSSSEVAKQRMRVLRK